MPKPLPKPPKAKPVSDWKPSIFDAAYRLDAYQDANLKRTMSGIRDRAFMWAVASTSFGFG